MNHRILITLIVCLAALAAPASAAEPVEPLVIRGDNTVLVDRGTYAGRWLQFYLIRCVAKSPDFMKYAPDAKADRAAAPAFPMVKNPAAADGRNVIAVGDYNRMKEFLDDEERKTLAAKTGMFLIRRKGNTIVIAANGGPWYFAPIHAFLDKVCGVRLYAPTHPEPSEEELWLSQPEDDEVVVEHLDILTKPYFAKTTFSSGGYKRNKEWLRMNTPVSEELNLRASHTIIRFFPPEKYYDKYSQLYPMHKTGKRPRPIGDAWNPCFADPGLAAEVAMTEVRRMMSAKRKPGYLSFAVMDCAYDCHCKVCQASLEKHNNNAANLWYTFLNKVARQCQKEFPGLYLTNYAYSNISIPKGMSIEPNIVVDNVIKSYKFTDKRYWEGQKREIMAFAGLGASWITHDWNFQAVTPRIYTRQLAAFLQWGAQNGMLGIYTEWSGQEYWYLNGANYWIIRELLSNPYQDPDALWRQYCRDMYGDGWEEMYRFYDMFQQKQVVADRYFERQDWPRQDSVGFTAEDLERQREWLETAMDKTADDPLIQRRLDAVMRYFRAHELLATATGVPGRLYHRHSVVEKNPDINEEALAFYVNDDGADLMAFEHYYENKRTLPPDSNSEDKNSGLRFSYRNNYARALGSIIAAVKREALRGVDLANATNKTVEEIVSRARDIYYRALPGEYDPKRAEDVAELMQKILWVPRVKEMPRFDGDLSDAAWAPAARLKGWTQADLLLPTFDGNETDGRIMRVGDSLVIGLECKQPKGIWAETPADVHTGTRIWREAGCEFFLGPPVKPGEKQEYFQYIVNAFGAFRGFRQAQDNRQGVRCAVKMAEDKKSYTIELALPLKVEGLYDYSKPGPYTFNVMRNPFYGNTFNSKERIGWAPIFFTAGVPESRGLVFIE